MFQKVTAEQKAIAVKKVSVIPKSEEVFLFNCNNLKNPIEIEPTEKMELTAQNLEKLKINRVF